MKSDIFEGAKAGAQAGGAFSGAKASAKSGPAKGAKAGTAAGSAFAGAKAKAEAKKTKSVEFPSGRSYVWDGSDADAKRINEAERYLMDESAMGRYSPKPPAKEPGGNAQVLNSGVGQFGRFITELGNELYDKTTTAGVNMGMTPGEKLLAGHGAGLLASFPQAGFTSLGGLLQAMGNDSTGEMRMKGGAEFLAGPAIGAGMAGVGRLAKTAPVQNMLAKSEIANFIRQRMGGAGMAGVPDAAGVPRVLSPEELKIQRGEAIKETFIQEFDAMAEQAKVATPAEKYLLQQQMAARKKKFEADMAAHQGIVTQPKTTKAKGAKVNTPVQPKALPAPSEASKMATETVAEGRAKLADIQANEAGLIRKSEAQLKAEKAAKGSTDPTVRPVMNEVGEVKLNTTSTGKQSLLTAQERQNIYNKRDVRGPDGSHGLDDFIKKTEGLTDPKLVEARELAIQVRDSSPYKGATKPKQVGKMLNKSVKTAKAKTAKAPVLTPVDGGLAPKPTVQSVAQVAKTARANQGMTQPTRIPTKAKPATPPSPVKETVTGKGFQSEDLFHGTKSEFNEFSLKNAGSTDPGLVGQAIYFSPTEAAAKGFSESPHYGVKGGTPRVVRGSVDLKNPLIVTDGRLPDGRTLSDLHPQGISKASATAVNKELKKAGYDGVIFKDADGAIEQVAVFDPQKARVTPTTPIAEAKSGTPSPVAQVARGAKVQTKQPVASPVKEVVKGDPVTPPPAKKDGFTYSFEKDPFGGRRIVKTKDGVRYGTWQVPDHMTKLADDADVMPNGYSKGQNKLIRMYGMKADDVLELERKWDAAARNTSKTPYWSDPDGNMVTGGNAYRNAQNKKYWEPLNEAARSFQAKTLKFDSSPRWERTPPDVQGKPIYVFARDGLGRTKAVAGPYHTHQEATAGWREASDRIRDQFRDEMKVAGASYGTPKPGEVITPLYDDLKSSGPSPFGTKPTPTAKTAKASDPVKPVAEVVKSPEQAASPTPPKDEFSDILSVDAKVQGAPVAIRRMLYGREPMATQTEKNRVFQWMRDNGLVDVNKPGFVDAPVRLAQALRDGNRARPMSEIGNLPANIVDASPRTGVSKSVLTGEIDGAPAWTDTHVMVVGEPPKGWNKPPQGFKGPDMQRIWNQAKEALPESKQVKPIAFEKDAEYVRVVLSTGDGSLGVVLDGRKMKAIEMQHPGVQWMAYKPERPVIAMKDGKPVGVIMPMRSDGLIERAVKVGSPTPEQTLKTNLSKIRAQGGIPRGAPKGSKRGAAFIPDRQIAGTIQELGKYAKAKGDQGWLAVRKRLIEKGFPVADVDDPSTRAAFNKLSVGGTAVRVAARGAMAGKPKEEKPSAMSKVTDYLNAPRTLQATGDVSATGRQGMFFLLTNPGKSLQANARAARAIFDPKYAESLDRTLRSSPAHALREKSGLYIANSKGPLNAREEGFMSNFVKKIPGVGQVVDASERHYNTVLNEVRASVFDDFVKKNPGLKPEEYQKWARFVNSATGRGTLSGKADDVLTHLSSVFYSPRFALSRFQTPGMVIQAMASPQSPASRKIIGDAAKAIGTAYTALKLAEAGGAKVDWDPASTNFLRVTVGKTTYDAVGGFNQPVKLLYRAAIGKMIDSTGKERPTNASTVVGQFVTGKLAPGPKLAYQTATNRDVMFGKPKTREQTAWEAMTPLVVQEIERMMRGGEDITKAIPVPFGIGASVKGQVMSDRYPAKRG